MTGGSVSSRLVSSLLTSLFRSLHEASVVVLAVRRVQLFVEVGQAKRRRAALHGIRVQERDAEEPEKVRHAPGPVQIYVSDIRKRFKQGGGRGGTGIVRRIRTPCTRTCPRGAPDIRKGFQQGRGRALDGWGVLRQRRTPCTGRVKTQYCQNGVRSYIDQVPGSTPNLRNCSTQRGGGGCTRYSTWP